VAEGWSEGNYSSIDVIDTYDREQVAHFRTHIPPDELGEAASSIGYYYNTALVVPEVNNHGGMVVMKLKDLKYPRIYMRERYDRTTQKESDVLGWRTDFQTKPLMIAYLNESLRNFEIKINCAESIDEMETFIQTKDGKLQAETGKDMFDDRVISLGIGNFLMKFLPKLGNRRVDNDELYWQRKFGTGEMVQAHERKMSRKTGY
jgi:hypothetical protein